MKLSTIIVRHKRVNCFSYVSYKVNALICRDEWMMRAQSSNLDCAEMDERLLITGHT